MGSSLQDRTKAVAGPHFSTEDGELTGLAIASHGGCLGRIEVQFEGHGDGTCVSAVFLRMTRVKPNWPRCAVLIWPHPRDGLGVGVPVVGVPVAAPIRIGGLRGRRDG